ncbi:c-type cytochrome [Malaciobacter mytili]|uniref:c-type cytochrome n=1 Tax=Malaciobacter mytili TaxID=603050 RepID=UPI003BB0B712
MNTKKIICISALISLFSSYTFAFDGKELQKRSDRGFEKPKMEYKVPDMKDLPDNEYGKLVKYGKELIVHTYKYIGPEVENPAMRYAGNNNSCQNCHLDAGTKKFSAPFVGTFGEFPQYRPREDAIGTLTARINGCMQRSMNGYPLPAQSKEMKAMEAYMHWLSQGYPVGGAKVEGRGLAKIDRKMIKQNKADVENGQKVYAQHCASCHGVNGEGVKNEGRANGYMFPALWGTTDTYNKGAGMYRVLKAADFIKSNMPLGATKENPILTDKEAYDVAAYMNQDSHYRPEKINRTSDFPDDKVKAPDVYRPNIESKEHQFGPFGKIIK